MILFNDVAPDPITNWRDNYCKLNDVDPVTTLIKERLVFLIN